MGKRPGPSAVYATRRMLRRFHVARPLPRAGVQAPTGSPGAANGYSTGFSSTPMGGISMRTRSPRASVKSSEGTMPVPVKR